MISQLSYSISKIATPFIYKIYGGKPTASGHKLEPYQLHRLIKDYISKYLFKKLKKCLLKSEEKLYLIYILGELI